jgi:hypothetical protein
MKKTLTAVILSAFVAAVAYAGTTPGTGVLNSPHDMNVVTGLSPDNQGRACAFCHTPHHAVDLGGEYNPLWSHQPTALAGVIPYQSATFDAQQNGALIDPLIGPSRLCMSCHDGAIAPDQHYGSTNVAPTGRFASDDFAGYPSTVKNIAVGLGGNFANDHPIGFDIMQSMTDPDIYPDVPTVRTWLIAGLPGTKVISEGLYKPTATSTEKYMTCATCHDVHNKNNVANNAANGVAGHTDSANLNYFVFAPQSGSQLCLSCHNK